MKKKKLLPATLTMKEGCDLYLADCRTRNLREGTINHYKQSYLKILPYVGENTPVSDVDENCYIGFVRHLKDTLHNDISINAYLRDYITTIHFLQNNGFIPYYKMQAIKCDKHAVQTYTDDELKALLAKPKSKCSYTEYQCWVMSNFLFCTGVRQHSLMEIKISDLDFENRYLKVRVTKNRKPLLVPLNVTLVAILMEYLKRRNYQSDDEFLFTNIYGQKLVKSTCYTLIALTPEMLY